MCMCVNFLYEAEIQTVFNSKLSDLLLLAVLYKSVLIDLLIY